MYKQEAYKNFIMWLSLTPRLRAELEQPLTLKGIGEELGITMPTMIAWRDTPEARLLVSQHAFKSVGNNYPEIVEAWVESMKLVGRAGAADRKAYFDLVAQYNPGLLGLLPERQEQTDVAVLARARDVLSPEEYAKLMASIAHVTSTVKRLKDGVIEPD